MYRFVLFTLGILIVGAQAELEGFPECERVKYGVYSCCKKALIQINIREDIKECFKLAKKPISCDQQDMCIGQKHGILLDDGTMNMQKIAKNIEEDFKDAPELVDSAKKNCANGDLSKYGPSDMCNLKKLRLCFEVEIIKSCDEWNDEGDCSGMKESIQKCVKQFE